MWVRTTLCRGSVLSCLYWYKNVLKRSITKYGSYSEQYSGTCFMVHVYFFVFVIMSLWLHVSLSVYLVHHIPS